MKAWPFLISANRALEYTPVVVPDFVDEAQAIREVIRASAGFRTNPSEAVYLKGFHSNTGILDMVFRIVEGNAAMLGMGGTDALRDRQGRPIRLIEGFVLRERPANPSFTTAQLNAAHAEIEPYFRKFWPSTDWRVSTSSAFDLPLAEGELLQLRQVGSPNLPKSSLPQSPDLTFTKRASSPSVASNQFWVFCGAAGVALGVYFTLKYFARKRDEDRRAFVDRIKHDASLHR